MTLKTRQEKLQNFSGSLLNIVFAFLFLYIGLRSLLGGPNPELANSDFMLFFIIICTILFGIVSYFYELGCLTWWLLSLFFTKPVKQPKNSASNDKRPFNRQYIQERYGGELGMMIDSGNVQVRRRITTYEDGKTEIDEYED